MKEFINDVYIPVSVGNPKFSNRNLKKVKTFLESQNLDATIVLFDSLRILTNVIKGQDLISAKKNAKIATEDLSRQIQKIFDLPNKQYVLVKSSKLMEEPNVIKLIKLLENFLFDSKKALSIVTNRAKQTLKNLCVEETVEHIALEKKYIIEETAISLYCLSQNKGAFEIYIKKENGLIDYIFKNKSQFPETSLLSNGRRFKSWKDIGVLK